MSRNIFLLIIFITALFLRIIYCLQTQNFKLEGDAVIYDKVGWNLAQGFGFSIEKNIPTAFVFPVYPIFLSFLYSVFGHNLTWVRIIQSIISALICILIYLVAVTFFKCDNLAKTSAIIAIFYPSFLIYTEYLINDLLVIFFLIITLYFLLKSLELQKNCYWMLAGISLGFLVLTRGEYILFIILLFFSGLFLKISYKEFLKKYFILLFFFTIIVSPWVIRNYLVFKKFPLISTRGGITLYNSYFLADKGFSFNQLKNLKKNDKKFNLLKTELEIDNYLIKKAITFIKQNPATFLKLIPVKVAMLFYPFDGKWYKLNLFSKYNLLFGLVFCFSLIGIFYIIKGKENKSYILFIPFLQTFFTCVMFYGKPQYRLPLEPILIILAVAGFFTLKEMSNKKIFYFIISSIFILNLSLFFASDLITQELKGLMNLITHKLPPG